MATRRYTTTRPASREQLPISAATSNGFTPSVYQQALFDFITSGRGDAMVNAVAGSGKTTSLVQAAKLIKSSSAIFLAFNRHIADELNTKLAGSTMQAKTIHSLGYGCLANTLRRKLEIQDRKYNKIAKPLVEDAFWNGKLHGDRNDRNLVAGLVSALQKLVDMARSTLAGSRAEVQALIPQFNIDLDASYIPAIVDLAGAALREGQEVARRHGVIDYTDMIYLPHALNCNPPKFDWLFIDEAQDLNAAQRELVLKCRAPGGRMVFVGDERQAIMGFAGADVLSYRTIQARTGAVELPLSICYRCPAGHLELARAYVPQIEARPGAADGTLETIKESKLPEHLQEGDLVLCRMTAPLIGWCIKLIQQKVPARVRGRDVAKELTKLAVKIAEPVEYSKFLVALEAYRHNQMQFLQQQEASDTVMQSLNDRCDALVTCYTSFPATTVGELCAEIDGLFSDERSSVWLSTIHKAKGLEADRVFVLYPEKLPLRWPGQRDDQYVQEQNLMYVALTRSKDTLIFVEGE